MYIHFSNASNSFYFLSNVGISFYCQLTILPPKKNPKWKVWKKVGILLLDKNFSNYHLVPVWCWARWLDHWAERWWRVHCVRAAPGTSFSYDSCCKGLGCTRKIKQNMTLRLNLQISLVHICPSFIYQYYKHRFTENWSFLTIQEIKNKSLDL